MKTITTVEELEAVHAREDAIIRGSGTYRDGMSTFTSCYAVPVPDYITGSDERYWAVIVHGNSWLDSLVKESDIRLPAALLYPLIFDAADVERAAEAMDRNYNPDQSPVLAAMFQDYARAALGAIGEVVE